MKHYGDITKLSGYDLPIVDVITGGSPCQDLSVAGKRTGLDGERSGLFMEQIRIVKEMREHSGRTADKHIRPRPRYMLWENVPGALSSNGGKDFQKVLTEIIKIVEPNAVDVPLPDRGGWTKSGFLFDEMGRWSVAWRIHDAQYWNVPQRRRRIAVLADFNGMSAGWIMFDPQYRRETEGEDYGDAESYSGTEPGQQIQPESESMSGDFEPCEEEGQGTAGGIEDSIGETGELIIEPRTQDGCARLYRGGITPTLNTASGGQRQPCVMVFEQNQREEVRNLGDCSSAVKAESGMHNQTFVLNDQGGQG